MGATPLTFIESRASAAMYDSPPVSLVNHEFVTWMIAASTTPESIVALIGPMSLPPCPS